VSEHLKKEAELQENLKKAGFTETQVTALCEYFEFNRKTVIDYIEDIAIDETEKELTNQLKNHRHIENGEVALLL